MKRKRKSYTDKKKKRERGHTHTHTQRKERQMNGRHTGKRKRGYIGERETSITDM